jgi:hypothetical protein
VISRKKPSLIVPVENQIREFDPKLLLSLVAGGRGYEMYRLPHPNRRPGGGRMRPFADILGRFEGVRAEPIGDHIQGIERD